jgi:hypothetical protein
VRPVVEAQPQLIAAEPGEVGQDRGIDRGRRLVRRDRHQVRCQRADLVPQGRRQDLLHFGQCPQRGFADAGDRATGGAARGRAQPHHDRDGLLVVEQQRRERRSCAEAVAADGPSAGENGIAETPQPLDVGADGAAGHAESFGEFGSGPVPPALQQRQQPEQAGR